MLTFIHTDDPLLEVWCKSHVPVLPLPPPNMGLVAWRDPFVISTPNSPCPGHDDGKYTMLLGSGLKSTGGGAAMIYKSERPCSGEAGKGTVSHSVVRQTSPCRLTDYCY